MPDFDAMLRRANTQPCPWCGKVSSLQRRSGVQAAVLPFKGFFYGVLHAGRNPQDFIKNGVAGFPVTCGSCAEQVCICPNCDTPNRTLGRMRDCTGCGKQFTVG